MLLTDYCISIQIETKYNEYEVLTLSSIPFLKIIDLKRLRIVNPKDIANMYFVIVNVSPSIYERQTLIAYTQSEDFGKFVFAKSKSISKVVAHILKKLPQGNEIKEYLL